jgi:hypothetical protein
MGTAGVRFPASTAGAFGNIAAATDAPIRTTVAQDRESLRKVYFHHIGKTAGTTLRNHLIRQAGARNVAPMIRGMSFKDAMIEYKTFGVITGHLVATPGDELPRDRICVTLLREPVDRLLSEFYFTRTIHTTGARHGDISGESLDAWLAGLSEDEQIKLNAHVDALWPFGWSERTLPALERRLAAAKRALDQFDLVGLQHLLHESIAVLDYRLGWRAPASLPVDNPTPLRPAPTDLPPATAASLRQLLAADIELFHYAGQRFAGQLRKTLVEATASHAERRTASAADDCTEFEARIGEEAGDKDGDPRGAAGTGKMVIDAVVVTGEISGTRFVQSGEWVTIRLEFRSHIDERDLSVRMGIRDHSGALVFGTSTLDMGSTLSVGPGRYAVSYVFSNVLGMGRYHVSAALHRGKSQLEGCFHALEQASEFEVIDVLSQPFEGRVRLNVEARAEALDDSSRILAEDATAGQPRTFALGRRNPALRDFHAELHASDRLLDVRRGADGLMLLDIVNRGAETWPAYGRQCVHVSHHWLAEDGRAMMFDGLRTALPHDVRPGQTVQLRCFFRAPEQEGKARLVWTLVQEEVAWFDHREVGSRLEQEVVVFD